LAVLDLLPGTRGDYCSTYNSSSRFQETYGGPGGEVCEFVGDLTTSSRNPSI